MECEQHPLSQYIYTKHLDSFLLARFHLDFLRDKISRGEVKNALKSLPNGSDAYDHIYNDSMVRIYGQTRTLKDLAMRTLGWIVCSERPLNTPELQHALAMKSMMKTFDEDIIPDIDLIIEACCGMVTVDENSGIIRLIHFTAQKYFERKWKAWFPDAHSDIATVCLAYLSLDVFKESSYGTEADPLRQKSKWALFDYAGQYWLHHTRLQTVDSPLTLELFADQSRVSIADQYITPRCFCEEDPCFQPPNNATSLHLAAYFGLGNAVRLLIDEGMESDPADKQDRTPLAWTSDPNVNLEVAQILLEKGADPNHVDKNGCTPLSWAAGFGNKGLVKLLLQSGARQDIKDDNSMSPLELAVFFEHEAVANILLEHGQLTYLVDSVNKETWDQIVE